MEKVARQESYIYKINSIEHGQGCIIHWQLARKVPTLSPPTDEKRRLVGNSDVNGCTGYSTGARGTAHSCRSYTEESNGRWPHPLLLFFLPSLLLCASHFKNSGHTFFYIYTSRHIFSRICPFVSGASLFPLLFAQHSKNFDRARLQTQEMQLPDRSSLAETGKRQTGMTGTTRADKVKGLLGIKWCDATTKRAATRTNISSEIKENGKITPSRRNQ
jgi:hypothetical protein